MSQFQSSPRVFSLTPSPVVALLKFPAWQKFCSLLLVGLSVVGLTASSAQAAPPEKMARIFWQDREKKTLMWGEMVKIGSALVLRNGGPVQGFPNLDKDRNELVQMKRIGSVLVVGIRDDNNGKLSSGWVAVDVGVDEMPHGDHSDYNYRNRPKVIAKVLDQSQGNPAHLYVYDNAFYLANDQLNGYTQLLPAKIVSKKNGYKGTFHRGGGAHITLAAVRNKVGYGTWIQGGGPEKGRVDVSDLTKTGEKSIAYSFNLPFGGLHGATANSGRVFFAPSDGVCWVDADLELKQTSETVTANHLSLGKDEENDRPLRTGAFVNHRNWLLFTTGPREHSALCLVDAAASTPSVVRVPIKVADGLSLVTPKVIAAATGKRYAFVFQNRKEGDVKEKLSIIDLDPNRDRNFADAAMTKSITVGPSQVDGHYGYHSIGFDDDARFGLMSNPGSGEIWIMSLVNASVIAKYKVGGMPTSVTVVGGEASKH